MAATDGHAGATSRVNHHVVPATAETVHWGYFSRSLKPVLALDSGDFVTIETLNHHAYQHHARLIAGGPGAESVLLLTKDTKHVDRRGERPTNVAIHLCCARARA